MVIHRFVIVLALIASGCKSLPAPNLNLGAAPQKFIGYEAATNQYYTSVTASFEPNYEDTFDYDLLDEGIIPIELTAKALDERADLGEVWLKPNNWNPRLFLQDGTALRLMEIDELKDVSTKVFKTASGIRFSPGDLRNEISGWLFFRLDPKSSFDVDGREITHRRGELSREIDLYHSLLSFTLTIKDETFPFYIGIKPQ
jgi:hypothetical protein